jgi:hypothetical protein
MTTDGHRNILPALSFSFSLSLSSLSLLLILISHAHTHNLVTAVLVEVRKTKCL